MKIYYLFILNILRFICYIFNLIKKNFIKLCLVTSIIITFFFIIYIKNYNLHDNEKKALLLNINGIIFENNNNIFWGKFGLSLFKIKNKKFLTNTLFNIVKIIHLANNNKNIIGMVLKLNNFLGADQVSLEYIGKALNQFKKNGKYIYAISNNYKLAQYYLASYANKIFIYPNGLIDLYGSNNDKIYYKSLLNKLKINTHIFRIGLNKTAIEPNIYDSMPNKTKKIENKLYSKLWLNYIYDIVKNRNLKPYELTLKKKDFLINFLNKKYINKYNLKYKIIDKILSYKKTKEEFIKIFGLNKKKNNYKFIHFYKYKIKQILKKNDNIISVIFINGKILNYNNSYQNINNSLIINKLKKARLNSKVKAVILRINSPGGSISASENIRNEILNLKLSGKPVIVSMSNLTASGGYWISTPANIIIADKNTITGSIGVFSVINTYEKILNFIGINYDGLNLFPNLNLKPNKSLTPFLSKIIELNIKNGYEHFIKLICKNRHLTPIEVNRIGQGQLFLGEEAKKLKLIDKIGDFDDAVKQAVKITKLKQWHLNWVI
ncbi:MAG: signal peptide peptidase SppA [Enterobacteriaceae bacterium PC38]|nr:MAG: signal peptide peptidase SppA [Enterobacteriaceae bacterium PC38]